MKDMRKDGGEERGGGRADICPPVRLSAPHGVNARLGSICMIQSPLFVSGT